MFLYSYSYLSSMSLADFKVVKYIRFRVFEFSGTKDVDRTQCSGLVNISG